jgi:hypothetical protein
MKWILLAFWLYGLFVSFTWWIATPEELRKFSRKRRGRRQPKMSPLSPVVPVKKSPPAADLNLRVITKPATGERYVWIFDDEHTPQFVDSVMKMVSDPELSLTAKDSLRLFKTIMHPASMPHRVGECGPNDDR